MSDSIDHAERERLLAVLGLDKDATWETIQSTYLQLMTVWNPDRFQDDLKLKMRIRKKTSEIKIAFAQLEELSGAFSKLQAIEEQRASRHEADNGFDISKDLRSDSVKMFKSSMFKEAEPEEQESDKPKKFESAVGTSLGSSLSHIESIHDDPPKAAPRTLTGKLAHLALAPVRAARRATAAIPAAAYRFYLRAGTQMWTRVTIALTALLLIVPQVQRFDMDSFLAGWMGGSSISKAQSFDKSIFAPSAQAAPAAGYYASFEGSPISKLRAASSSAGSKIVGSISRGIEKPREIFPSSGAPAAAQKRKGPFKEERKLAPGLYVYE